MAKMSEELKAMVAILRLVDKLETRTALRVLNYATDKAQAKLEAEEGEAVNAVGEVRSIVNRSHARGEMF